MIKFILFTVFIFMIALFLMGFTAVRTFFNILFGGSSKSNGKPRSNSNQRNHQSSSSEQNFSGKKQDKIFSSNEGEYIDFEEIKETK